MGLKIQSLEPASADASFRRYFRVRDAGSSYIVMDAPPDREKTAPFLQAAAIFAAAGLNVPTIHAIDSAQGFLLLEDFGTILLLDRLQAVNDIDAAGNLYQPALDSLFRLQTSINPDSSGLPYYDAAWLLREFGIFEDWFLGQLLALHAPAGLLEPVARLLIDSALEQPQVCVHRDYHSRNLMLPEQADLGILDFQDAVCGPISYDLVSLLRDCYVSWPQTWVTRWTEQYYQRLRTSGLVATDYRHFQRWFDLMGMQRHLKAVGIFARLHLRDGKSAYLADIPRTLGYVCDVCTGHDELQDFGHFLRQRVLPALRKIA